MRACVFMIGECAAKSGSACTGRGASSAHSSATEMTAAPTTAAMTAAPGGTGLARA